MKAASKIRRESGRDRRRQLITPEGIVLPITIASRGARAGALVMDMIIIGLLQFFTTLALILMGFGSLAAATHAVPTGALEFLVVIWFIVMFLFRNAYFLFFELGPRGATPGKRLSGIRVAARDGSRLSVEMVVARNLLRDIELFLPIVFIQAAFSKESGGGAAGLAAAAWFLIFVLFPFWNTDRLRAGDIIAGTWVVERPASKLPAVLGAAPSTASVNTAPLSVYRFTEQELDAYGEFELQALERVLRDNRPDALRAVHQTITRKINSTAGEGDEQAFLTAYYAQLRARLESRMRMGQRKADKHSTPL